MIIAIVISSTNAGFERHSGDESRRRGLIQLPTGTLHALALTLQSRWLDFEKQHSLECPKIPRSIKLSIFSGGKKAKAFVSFLFKELLMRRVCAAGARERLHQINGLRIGSESVQEGLVGPGPCGAWEPFMKHGITWLRDHSRQLIAMLAVLSIFCHPCSQMSVKHVVVKT